MDNIKKKAFVEKIQDIASDFTNYISIEFPDCNSYFGDKMNEGVYDLLNIEKPKVMVYGIYNSGKSTLINSLCKSKVAEMADRPMTDRITEYDRGDYILVDSPGVDAPIEHEKVTEESLNKCHIILFVISTKGMFEDRDNYRRLAELITKDIPFIIVLNDRGIAINPELSNEEKKNARINHEQELRVIQYKVIQNLIEVSKDKKITDKYEVVILNAKKALKGIESNKTQLYDASGVRNLDKRITQLLNSSRSIAALLKQPISNLKACMNEAEQTITKKMSGNTSENFEMRLHILAVKKENIMEDLRVIIRQEVNRYLEELTVAYINRDTDVFEKVKEILVSDIIESQYTAKVHELLEYVDRNFKSLHLDKNVAPKLILNERDLIVQKSEDLEEEVEQEIEEEYQLPQRAEKNLLEKIQDFFKSKDQREKEKLEEEAEFKNQQIQYKAQEKIRKRQEARQAANSDLDDLYRILITVVSREINKKYDDIVKQIQQFNNLNKQTKEECLKQMEQLKDLRNRLDEIENSLS